MKHLFSVLVALLFASSSHAKPNVLFLLADDQGYADLGVQGCTDVPTPNIDSIAKNGVRFTNGYVSAPVCSPTRAGLMTGRYQTRFGHELNHPLADRAPVGLPVTEKLAGQWMKEAGYTTGHIGKWHLGNPKLAEYAPHARGFDESVWFPGQKKLPVLTPWRNGVMEKANDRFVDEGIAREASAFIEKHQGNPWFLYVAFLTPHQPLDTPPGTEEPFAKITDNERRKCAAMLTLLDGSVGRILQTLRDTKQDENTLVVYLSDNGAPPKNGSRNTPLTGGKGTTWEGGIREPFLMQWKGVLPANKVINEPVISLDLLPTALAAVGVEQPVGAKFDGVNLLPFLTGQTKQAPHDNLFWRYGRQWAVRSGDWKLVNAQWHDGKTLTTTTRLINLTDDIKEEHDLSGQFPDKRRALQARYDRWNAINMPPLWGDDGGKAED